MVAFSRKAQKHILSGSRVKVSINLRGDISTKRPKIHIWSYKRVLFGGFKVNVSRNLRGSILPERPKMHILGYKLAHFVELEWKLGTIYVLAFYLKGQKCTFLDKERQRQRKL